MMDMDWIDLAQDKDRMRTLLKRKWSYGFRKMQAICWLAEELLTFQEGLCSMELVS